MATDPAPEAPDGTRLRAPGLPAPRAGHGGYRVELVCLGNICRSPMAAAVLRRRLAEAGIDDRVQVLSAGTGDWHLGEPADPRASATLRAHGYDPSGHRARQVSADRYAEADLVLAMDERNHADLLALAPAPEDRERTWMFRDLDPGVTNTAEPAAGPDANPATSRPGGSGTAPGVPDPYYGGDDGFEEVLAIIERTCAALVDRLRHVLDEPHGPERAPED